MTASAATSRPFPGLRVLQPRSWLLTIGQLILGYALAWGPGGLLRGTTLTMLIPLLLVWVVLLGGGARLLEEGYARLGSPDRRASYSGLIVMLLGQVAALHFASPVAMLYAVAVIIALAYGAPPLQLRKRPGMAWIARTMWIGFLAPYAGWGVTARPFTSFSAWTFSGLALLIGALLLLEQLPHSPELQISGESGVALRLGVDSAIMLAASVAAAGLAVIARGVALASPTPLGWLAYGAGVVGWVICFAPWLKRGDGFTLDQHLDGYRVAVGAYLATAASLLYALAM